MTSLAFNIILKDLGLELDLGLNFLVVLNCFPDSLYPDSFFIIESSSKGSPKILKEFKCTTNPSSNYKQKPTNFIHRELEVNVKNMGCWELSKKGNLIQTGGPIAIKRGKNGSSEIGFYGINLYCGGIETIGIWTECSIIVPCLPNMGKMIGSRTQTQFSLFVISSPKEDSSSVGG